MERTIALKRGAEHERVKAQTELGRYKTERDGSQIKRVQKAVQLREREGWMLIKGKSPCKRRRWGRAD